LLLGMISQDAGELTYLRSLQNPSGVARALTAVKDRTGGPPGAIGLRLPNGQVVSSSTDDAGEDGSSARMEDVLPVTKVSDQIKQQDRWSQIRAVNMQQNARASWDNIRRAQSKQKPNSSEPQHYSEPQPQTASTTDPDGQRLSEQAEFDAMLEAERRISSDENMK